MKLTRPRPYRLARFLLQARLAAWAGAGAMAGVAGLALASLPSTALAQADAFRAPPARMSLSAERLELANGENLGLVGTTYTIELLPSLWAGPAAYGGVSGQRGGLLVVGAEAGWQGPSFGPLSFGAGIFAGGGGGGSAPVGSGLMLRPHVDLMWRLGPRQKLGLSWSRVRFPNGERNGQGEIDSRQIGLLFSYDTEFRHVASNRVGESFRFGGRTGIGFDRVHALAGVYRPSRSATRLDGSALPRNIGFAGARLERSFGDGWYWGMEAAGGASGGVAGYAEYLGTLGLETLLSEESVAVGARVALGAGGGGQVDTGGGLLWKAGAYGIVRLANDLGLTLEAGMARAPQGTFKATYGSAAFTWILDDRIDSTAPSRVTRMEWVAGVERYDAARRDGSVRRVELVSLRVNRAMTEHFYLSAQAHSAAGGDAGGYSVGLLGLGLRTPLGARWHAGIEALGGAAGGGGVDTAGGAVVQPMAYIGYDLNPSIALRVGAGRLRALRGPLDANVVEASLAFSFGVASRGYR